MSVSPSVSAVMSAAVVSACMTAQGLALPAILWASTRERGAMAPTSARKTAGSWSGPAAAPAWAYKTAAAQAGRSGTESGPVSDGRTAAAKRTADASHTSARPTGLASSALPYLVAALRNSVRLKASTSVNRAGATEVQ